MNFTEANQYLLSLGHETLAMKLGLRNTELLIEKLGNPHKYYEAVQIAGTNGKGSTAAMLDSICRAAGISTGLYTSPHLVSITERIKIDGHEISEHAFASYATEVRVAAEALVAARELEALPTFFEHVTVIALLAFKDAKVQLVILETGMGGRLDSTTAVRAKTVAITPISLDHQEYLGDTLAEIAGEKAAVIHAGCSVVVSPQPEGARRVIVDQCGAVGVTPVWSGEDIRESETGYSFRTARDSYEEINLALPGRHQSINAATAIDLAETLGEKGFKITHDAIVCGLETATHPGRLEMFGDRILLDGAHNPAGAAALREYLDENVTGEGRSITLVFGAMVDKQVDEMTAALFPVAARLILTQPTNARAAKAAGLSPFAKKYAPHAQLEITDSSQQAMELASTFDNDFVVVTGSLYLVGEVRAWLTQQATVPVL